MRPEPEDLAWPRLPFDQDVLAEEDQQRVERRQAEERGRLVERGLVEHELVAVVETGELGDDDDERQGDERRGLQGVVAEDGQRQNQRERGRHDVGSGRGTAGTSRRAGRPRVCGFASAIVPADPRPRRARTAATGLGMLRVVLLLRGLFCLRPPLGSYFASGVIFLSSSIFTARLVESHAAQQPVELSRPSTPRYSALQRSAVLCQSEALGPVVPG